MTEVELTLVDGEVLMVAPDELMFRQITTPLLDSAGKVSTSAFGPRSVDQQMPSYARNSLVDAQDARDWHSSTASKPSLGVWAVSVREVIATGSQGVDDSATPLSPGATRSPGHCFVNFRGLAKQQERELRTALFFEAMRRGEIETEDRFVPAPDPAADDGADDRLF